MKILFAADMSFNYFDEISTKEKANEVFEKTSEQFKKADFSVLNLENIFGDEKNFTPIVKSGPNLISDESFIEYVNTLNPTVIGIANNHTKDYGEQAMFYTINLLKETGYNVIGAGKNIDEAYKSAVLEKDGVKCAIIAVCENEFGTSSEDESGTAGFRLSMVAKAIKTAKDNGQLPIIYFHGGNEYNPFPSPKKVELYRHFIDIGAKAVVAMHTHCPQGYEMYDGCPIVYSMGNFYFPSKKNVKPSWNYGYMTLLDVNSNEIKTETIPYKFGFDYHTVLEEKEKDDFIKYLDFISGEIKDDKKIKDYFDSWCMMAGPPYAKHLLFDLKLFDEGDAESVKHIKNNFSCEAHNELLNNTLKIIYDGRVEQARCGIEKIKKLQNLEL